MVASVKELRERALMVLSSRERVWFSTDCIGIAIDDAAGEPIDCTEIDAALDALVAEGKVELDTIDGVALYSASSRRPVASSNRWHETLERKATEWERLDGLVSRDMCRRMRATLAVGVRTKHEATLVLVALGFETSEGINAVLGKDAS